MADIQTELKRIQEAVYGREVRSSIHDSIEQCYSDVTNAKTLADSATTNANNAASAANSAATKATDIATTLQTKLDNGEFKGEKGDPGETKFSDLTDEQKASLKGKDGVSPTVTTSKSGSTATIKITDVNGDHTFTLTDAGVETPVSIANGGTGAATAVQARTNLGITPDGIGAAKADHTHSTYVAKSGDTMTGSLTVTNTTPSVALVPTDQSNVLGGNVVTTADGGVFLQGTLPNTDYRQLVLNTAASDKSYGVVYNGSWGGLFAGYRVFHEGWKVPMANLPFKVAYGTAAASPSTGKEATLDYSAAGFTAVPVVVATYSTEATSSPSVSGYIKVYAKTTTSALLTLTAGDSSSTRAVDWIAIGV